MIPRSFRFGSAPVVAGILSYAPWIALLGVLSYLSWFITDDAFIAFRYVRNFVEGHGLVFNPGERVEGYSSFLWVLELAAIWKIFGLPPEDVAQWLSVGYTAGVIALLLWWVRSDATLRNRGLAGWMALGLVCGSATFAVWTSGGGLETRQFTFFVMAAIVALAVHGGSRWGLLAASFSLAGASLTRTEGILIAACCFGWFCVSRSIADWRRSDALSGTTPDSGRVAWRRFTAWIDWREIACLIGPFVVLVGVHLAFRLVYYGEWLPNTYYAKIVRPWYEAGFRYYLGAAVDTGLYLLVPLALLAMRTRWRSRRDTAYALPLLCIFVHMIGVMRVGGDHFEYRPLDFYWPALSVPVSAAILDLGSRISESRLLRRFTRLGPASGANAWSLVIFAPLLFYCSAIQGVLLLAGARTVHYTNKLHFELNEGNTGWFLAIPGMTVLVPISNDLRRLAAEQSIALTFAEHRAFARDRIRKWSPYENMERGLIPKEAVTLGAALGISYYYLPDLTVVDSAGLTDATIARTPVDTPNFERQIAHDRRPSREYIEERGVNINVDPPAHSEHQALLRAPYALKVGADLWLPFSEIRIGGLNESIIAKFPEHALSIGNIVDIDDLLDRRESAVIQSDYDVHLVDNYIVYRKEKCLEIDVGGRKIPDDPGESPYRFFLHIVPINPDDLPVDRRRYGFDNFDFHFADYGREIDGNCVAVRLLPRYAIASIRTGEFAIAEFRHIWEGSVNFVDDRGMDDAEIANLLRRAGSPAIRSDYDVYFAENHVIYKKTQCKVRDVKNAFFLHIFPVDPDDLPDHRRPYRVDNLDFAFSDFGRYLEGNCIAVRKLPDYPIASIATGQLQPGGDRTWENSFNFVKPAGSGVVQ